MTSPFSLTSHLLATQQELYESATQHPFLLSAAKGTLPKQVLSRWLANDRLYIHSYIRASGKLLESIELPRAVASLPTEKESFETRLVDWVIEALVAVRREERLFLDVAGRYDLVLEMEPTVGTGSLAATATAISASGGAGEAEGELPGLKVIRGLFQTVAGAPVEETGKKQKGGGGSHGVIQGLLSAVTGGGSTSGAPSAIKTAEEGAAPGTPGSGPATPTLPWLEGALTFWGTERCYLDAWSWAKAQQPEGRKASDDADGGALRKEFIPNWSSAEFADFVRRLGELIDEAVREEIAKAGSVEEGEEVKGKILERVEARWKTLLEGERAFWPEV